MCIYFRISDRGTVDMRYICSGLASCSPIKLAFMQRLLLKELWLACLQSRSDSIKKNLEVNNICLHLRVNSDCCKMHKCKKTHKKQTKKRDQKTNYFIQYLMQLAKLHFYFKVNTTNLTVKQKHGDAVLTFTHHSQVSVLDICIKYNWRAPCCMFYHYRILSGETQVLWVALTCSADCTQGAAAAHMRC